jgi:hypothetical protein
VRIDNLHQAGKIHNLQQVCGVSGCVKIHANHMKISTVISNVLLIQAFQYNKSLKQLLSTIKDR